MSSKVVNAEFLCEYELEADWAASLGISQRTSARYRADGLPYLNFGGCVWIHKRGGREYIASRIVRRNPPRRRKAIAASPEINRGAV
jgi:hypothetical protein